MEGEIDLVGFYGGCQITIFQEALCLVFDFIEIGAGEFRSGNCLTVITRQFFLVEFALSQMQLVDESDDII